eukprot:c20270_g1_i1 orf=444-2627(-)
MGVYKIVVDHEGTSHELDFDSDDGLEVLRFQLFSLTMVSPENQTILDSSMLPLENEAELLARLASATDTRSFTLLDEAAKRAHEEVLAEIENADEALARLLQAEEAPHFLKQQTSQDGQQEFASRLEDYISQVLQYEDPSRQEKARETVQLDELEEKAVIALAKEGKRNPTPEELEHYVLFQLLIWFKKFFRWINSAPCFLCGVETDNIGMGKPTSEELQFGGNRVELFRCKMCHSITRFPRYNDTRKLIETRSGRCGEWANCFTQYCRAFGYQARLVLDFTDHVWTECFSNFLGRWIHLDPCEGAFDKPLLYEQGWGKKLNYLIAFSKDGVLDVTKRYTRNWEEVRLRRTLTSEQNVANVVANLTARLRRTFSKVYLEQLRSRDEEEAAELNRFQRRDVMKLEALPGRLTGTTEWRKARGELGSSTVPHHNAGPKRPCVDHLVSKIFLALGDLNRVCEKGSSVHMLKNILEALLNMLKQLQKAPYKTRRALFSLQSAEVFPLVAALDTDKLQQLFQALGLVTKKIENFEVCLTSQDPVETALALPVALETIESMIDSTKIYEGSDIVLQQLAFFAENERLSGAWADASGEEPPFGIASSAFDGLQSTKWEEPEGAKGGWLAYYLPSNSDADVEVYELMSANDCPERDPKDWVLEGSNDGGCTWTVLDTRDSQLFSKRYERKCYGILLARRMLCNAFRLQFLAVRDSSSQSRLQLSCVNFYIKKGSA